MNINPNGFPINGGVPLPFLPPPPGAPPTFNPTDSWTPSAPVTQAPAYQPQPSVQAQAPTQAQAPAQDSNYQFACFRPENWTYPSTLVNNTYTPGTANQDPRAAMLRQREDAFNQNRRNMAMGWNNYSRNVVDPNRGGYAGGGYAGGAYSNGNNNYGNGYNNYSGYNTPGSYMYGGRRNNGYY
jgi:hypothetical protein